ncbi:MAG TPA: DUF3016 domain-containing protein [Albitalea sp.]|nr:DUF3016 domain-containing protein [Albitalea sp.]
MRLTALAFVVCLAAAGAAQAGTVNVSFAAKDRFSDAGSTPWDEKANREAIAQYLQTLGPRYLAADQNLKVEILDIDLAGEPRPLARHGRELRVVKGRADWPRITLRYTLESNGKVLRSGEETVSDMSYTSHVPEPRASEPLHYEKRMLSEWFRKRFTRPD